MSCSKAGGIVLKGMFRSVMLTTLISVKPAPLPSKGYKVKASKSLQKKGVTVYS